MEFNQYKDIFMQESKKSNIIIEEEKIEKMYKYMQILLEWNEKINLTAITQEEDIIKKHFIDSLTILDLIKKEDKVIDIGSGAGFPGIPIAINKDCYITLLDSLNKRVKFLEEVKNEINLKNVYPIHGRAEEIARNSEYREKYDVSISRAVASMRVLLEYQLPFLKIGGIGIFMKGPNVKEELIDIESVIRKLGGKYLRTINFKINGEMERNIVIIEKVKKTNPEFPRKAGIPTKQPLE